MGPIDPIEGSKELHGVQTCRRPPDALVICDSSSKTRGLRAAFGHLLVLFADPEVVRSSGYVIYDSISKTRGLRAASGHRLVLFLPFR